MNDMAGEFAAIAVTLYAAHHVGDYWIQTGHQARHKGDTWWPGRIACLNHVVSYVSTQAVFLFALGLVLYGNLDNVCTGWGAAAGLTVSGVTHYLADRREHGVMFKLARLLPGKAAFLALGVPRGLIVECRDVRKEGRFLEHLDNPTLGTGAWALDQAWHIFWSVFVAALLAVAL